MKCKCPPLSTGTQHLPSSHTASDNVQTIYAFERTLARVLRTSKRACSSISAYVHGMHAVVAFAWHLIQASGRQLGSEPTCFLSFRTLNLSKSLSCLLFWNWARFFAQVLSAHFLSTSAFSHADLTVPLPVPRGSLGRTIWVSDRPERGAECRGTGPFSEGPSTST